MKPRQTVLEISWRRRITDYIATGFAVLTVVLVLVPLVAIFGYLVYKGIGSINWAFLTQTPKPPGEIGGGMANAIAGSVLILAIASLMGVPLGIGAGIYLAEYGRNRFGDSIRFVLGRAQRRALDRDRYRGLRPSWCCDRNISQRSPAVSRWPS